jgi:hypothetical protein
VTYFLIDPDDAPPASELAAWEAENYSAATRVAMAEDAAPRLSPVNAADFLPAGAQDGPLDEPF